MILSKWKRKTSTNSIIWDFALPSTPVKVNPSPIDILSTTGTNFVHEPNTSQCPEEPMSTTSRLHNIKKLHARSWIKAKRTIWGRFCPKGRKWGRFAQKDEIWVYPPSRLLISGKSTFLTILQKFTSLFLRKWIFAKIKIQKWGVNSLVVCASLNFVNTVIRALRTIMSP